MANKEHKPAKSSKQVYAGYAEREMAGVCISCARLKTAKDSEECLVSNQTPRNSSDNETWNVFAIFSMFMSGRFASLPQRRIPEALSGAPLPVPALRQLL